MIVIPLIFLFRVHQTHPRNKHALGLEFTVFFSQLHVGRASDELKRINRRKRRARDTLVTLTDGIIPTGRTAPYYSNTTCKQITPQPRGCAFTSQQPSLFSFSFPVRGEGAVAGWKLVLPRNISYPLPCHRTASGSPPYWIFSKGVGASPVHLCSTAVPVCLVTPSSLADPA